MNLSERLFARTEPLQVDRTLRTGMVLGGCILILSIWASWATLDEQVRAPGTVIVSSRSQVIQAVDGGVLQKLHVREGDTVKANDLLAELDTGRADANKEEVGAKVIALTATIERLQAELEGRPLDFSKEVAPYKDIVSAQTNLYERRKQFQSEEQSAIEQSRRLAEQELRALEKLAETGDASQTEVLRLRRQVSELRASAINKRNTYRSEAQTELTRSRSELESTKQQLLVREEQVKSTRLTAPMSGVVKNVRFTTLGAVLRAGDELMQIVPSDEPLLIEARVRSSDVAFLRKDLRASVSLDAYDSSIYGNLEGHVTYISPDTLEEGQGNTASKRDEQPSYRVHVQIDHIPEQHRDKIEVRPGMTSTVAIITGERTVAQYLLKPLRRMGSEALVER